MLLFNRLRNANAFRLKHGLPVDDLLGDLLEWAEVFVAYPSILDVAEQATCRLPWNTPFPVTWLEWVQEKRPDGQERRTGCMLFDIPNSILSEVAERHTCLRNADHAHIVYPFYWQTSLQHAVVGNSHHTMVYHNHGRPAEAFSYHISPEPLPGNLLIAKELPESRRLQRGNSIFNRDGALVAVAFSVGTLAAMSCRNVTAEEYSPTPNEIRRATRAGIAEPILFRTLRINLPTGAASQATHASVTASTEHRLHMVRGHFKNLRSKRYKDPGMYWWPAHLRGSADAGEVHKSYGLSGNQHGGDVPDAA